jgi:hypothetical protein
VGDKRVIAQVISDLSFGDTLPIVYSNTAPQTFDRRIESLDERLSIVRRKRFGKPQNEVHTFQATALFREFLHAISIVRCPVQRLLGDEEHAG